MLYAGSSETVITPKTSQFLFGYPNVNRYSESTHDDLMSAALYLQNGITELLFITNDIIFITKSMSQRIRAIISKNTTLKDDNIMITATHTHSGPNTTNYASNVYDSFVPDVDEEYVSWVVEKIAFNAIQAFKNKTTAVLGFSVASSRGIGTNRRNPHGPSDHEVPLIVVKKADSDQYLACMIVVNMHPTVLHEDSLAISADFPGFTKSYLKTKIFGPKCPILYHTGPSGNQSPRHVVKENTFKEAQRLGEILGESIEATLPNIEFLTAIELDFRRSFIEDPPRKEFITSAEAQNSLIKIRESFEKMKKENAPSSQLRTVECDIFGAEETLTLSILAEKKQLSSYYESCLPIEIQAFKIANKWFVGWAGEVFVEYGLALKSNINNSYVITLANGELQGYVVTEGAVLEGGYEASNSLFTYQLGSMLLEKTIQLIS